MTRHTLTVRLAPDADDVLRAALGLPMPVMPPVDLPLGAQITDIDQGLDADTGEFVYRVEFYAPEER